METIGLRLEEVAEKAEDLLLVYFAGHGLLVGPSGELHLCVATTRNKYARWTALPFSRIREVVYGSQALSRVVVLDCCFSGRAISLMGDLSAVVSGQLEIKGCYTLTSTSANMPAHAPLGERHTAFTGELLTLLVTGITDGPDLITLEDIYRHTLRSLRARGLPEPQQLGTATVDQLALTRNRARSTRVRVDPTRGGDLRYDLTITFEEAFLGTEKDIDVECLFTCEECSGNGMIGGTVCQHCSDEGRAIGRKRYRVTIPRGVDTGSQIRLSGLGDAGIRNGSAGDLYIVLRVQPHSSLRREDRDLVYELRISTTQATYGDAVEIPSVDGPIEIAVPPGTQYGQVFRLAGRGMPHVRTGQRGDQFVVVQVIVPTDRVEPTPDRAKIHGLTGRPVRVPKGFFEKLREAIELD
jgi:hypothetical protein